MASGRAKMASLMLPPSVVSQRHGWDVVLHCTSHSSGSSRGSTQHTFSSIPLPSAQEGMCPLARAVMNIQIVLLISVPITIMTY